MVCKTKFKSTRLLNRYFIAYICLLRLIFRLSFGIQNCETRLEIQDPRYLKKTFEPICLMSFSGVLCYGNAIKIHTKNRLN